MTVAGVFTVANVGDDQHLGRFPADSTNGALHDSVFIIGAGRHLVLAFRQAKQNDAPDPQRLHPLALFDKLVDR